MLQSEFIENILDLKPLMDAIPLALILVDNAGEIIASNSQANQTFGYTQAELIGKTIDILVPERFRPQHPAHRRQFFKAPEARRMGVGRDLYGQRKDGSEFPIEIGLNPVEADDGLFVLSAIVDITQRKRLEARFRAMVEAAPTAMVMIDENGTIVVVNQETEKLFAYSRDELVGRSIEVLVPERFRPQHPAHRRQFFKAPEARRMGVGRDLYGQRKDGSEFPVEIGLNPITTEDGVFVLSAIVDITERKQAELAVQQANQNLERSNRELQDFAYVVSHDLQAPLRNIQGFLQILQMQSEASLDEKGLELVERCVNSAKHLQKLIRDLLAFSRIESQGGHFEHFALQEVLDEALDLLEYTIIKSGAQIEIRSELPELWGDRRQIGQLFQNLIDNAVKYRGETVPQIQISAAKQAEDWLFQIQDNGIGIEPQFHERIFKIFQRLHTQTAFSGTGIGLAICQRIIQRHEGNIWVESQASQGSRFCFTIPHRS